MNRSIYVGFDPREAAAYAVCRSSLLRHMSRLVPIKGLVLDELKRIGLYHRPMEWRKAPPALGVVMWDTISNAAMSTQHANARFLVPHLAMSGWALFCDGDMLYRDDVIKLFDSLSPQKAIYCVKHQHDPKSQTKMDGQLQTKYQRKNWSSFMIFNCEHPANKALTVEMVNTVPGRDLHRFCWLEDDELIGELDPAWNYLVGETNQTTAEPKCVHFSLGLPNMAGYNNVEFSDEWWEELARWAS